MYHIFSIHSFTDGHLGCFQHLAIVNCAAINIGVHIKGEGGGGGGRWVQLGWGGRMGRKGIQL